MSYYEGQTDAVRDLYRYGLELTLRLRNRNDGLDPRLLDGLLRALDACRLEWEGAAQIPRVAVALLVDLSSAILNQADVYDEPDRTAIREAGLAVWNKINEAVHVPEEPPPTTGERRASLRTEHAATGLIQARDRKAHHHFEGSFPFHK